MQETEYQKLGFKAGLEVHQQLDTGKLFIRTPSTLTEETDFTIERKLRPVASELGEYDKTALDAFTRRETFFYSGKRDNISLVELDEEPPQPMDEDALKTALEVALLCKSNVFNKITTMRKTVIDGSNTSAFQRTALLSLGGKIEAGGKKYGVQTIVLEEDACRPIKKEAGKVYYNLDRLGIPLIELATDPDIKSPSETVALARKIGEIMRLTCRTKRGKGTIRQDVNVSIAEGARCEIKGCQELETLGIVAEKEVERQIDLLKIKKILLEKYGKKEKVIFSETKELTNAFATTECKFIKGGKIFGIAIKNAKGLLGEKVGAKRFGTELSAYAKAKGVSGLIHLDELPNYGISEKEVEAVKGILGCNSEDSFVFIVAEKEKALIALEAVKERFLRGLDGVIEETRGALEDGSSEYQRPLSGEARMYPETDIPSRTISEKELSAIEKQLPKSVEEREKLYAKMGLSSNHIEEMKLSNYARFFEEIVAKGANAKVSANLLLQTLTELKREGIEVEKAKLSDIEELLLLEAKGKINKSVLASAVKELVKGKSVEEVLLSEKEKAGLINENEVKKIISEIVSKNLALVQDKGMGAIGPLMGDLTKEPALKGVDGKMLSELLRKEIQAQK